MLRWVVDGGSKRFEMDGDAEGEVDMRSLSDGSSEAFLLRPDMLWKLGESMSYHNMSATIIKIISVSEEADQCSPECEGNRLTRRCGANIGSL